MMVMRAMVWLTVAVVLVVLAVHEAFAQQGTAQEQVERAIGSLVVRNAQCTEQTFNQTQEIARLKKELEEAKAKK